MNYNKKFTNYLVIKNLLCIEIKNIEYLIYDMSNFKEIILKRKIKKYKITNIIEFKTFFKVEYNYNEYNLFYFYQKFKMISFKGMDSNSIITQLKEYKNILFIEINNNKLLIFYLKQKKLKINKIKINYNDLIFDNNYFLKFKLNNKIYFYDLSFQKYEMLKMA